MPLIRYSDVEIRQQENIVLEDVNLRINAGEFVYLIGKVGSGKSSLLKTIYGELPIHRGLADVLGYDITHLKRKRLPALRKRIGIVFQDFKLLTDRNVHDNLSFVLRATGWKHRDQRESRIREVLDLVGMSTKGYKMPHELSGGEQQRIAIARAILNEPDIILADEPTGNLDAETGSQIVELLKSVCAKGSTVVMTTHNLALLEKYPGHVYKCENHRLAEVGPAVAEAIAEAEAEEEAEKAIEEIAEEVTQKTEEIIGEVEEITEEVEEAVAEVANEKPATDEETVEEVAATENAAGESSTEKSVKDEE